jgi:hypothetical protein
LLKEREDEVSKLDGELIALNISNEDQRRTLEEQSATVVNLQQAVEGGRQALEVERKQVEGELRFCSFVLLIFPSGVRSLLDFLCSWYPDLRTTLGHATDRAETLQAAYDSSVRLALLDRPTGLEGRGTQEARWQAVCAPFAGTSRGACAVRFTWAFRRPSVWCDPTTR